MLEALATSVYASLAWARRRPLRCFLVVAFAISWVDWITLAASGGRIRSGRLPTDLAGMAGPALAAFLVTAVAGGERALRELALRVVRFPWRDPWPWLLGPSPLAALLLVVAVREMAGLPVPPLASFARYPGLPDMPLLATFDLVLVGVGFGQEIGWRGVLLPRLQGRLGPLAGALAVAIPWGLWLLPLPFLHGLTRTSSPPIVPAIASGAALVVASSLILAFIVARSGGGLASAATWHACLRFATGSPGARDGVGVEVTFIVVACAVVLLAVELRYRRTGGTLLVPDTSRKS